MVCAVCKGKENLFRVKNEEGRLVQICESCHNKLCEGYELFP